MTLKEWIDANHVSRKEFLDAIGWSSSGFYAVESGMRPMSKKLARDIEAHTKGRFTKESLRQHGLLTNETK